jgi:hypothetical protein
MRSTDYDEQATEQWDHLVHTFGRIFSHQFEH